MTVPAHDTVECWALDYIQATDLATKLSPPTPPSAWEERPPARRVEKPGRPPELRPRERKTKSPRPGALAHPAQRADVLHRFLHHELQAAELLAWGILAFPEAAAPFRRGLLAILRDELRHMALYRAHLEHLGFAFGDLPINDWFWARVPASPSPAHFVSVLGMGLEGGNLDHALRFRDRFLRVGDDRAAAIQEVVVREEIPHVAFALHWFRAFTGGLEFSAWEDHLPSPLSPMMMFGTPMNLEDRRRAGFPDAFLDELSRWTPRSPGS